MAWAGGSAASLPLLLLSAAAFAVVAEDFAWEPPAMTRMDSLFVTAARGEPRFAPARDSCERELLALTGRTLEYLLDGRNRPEAGRTPRQRHYTERLLAMMADSGRNPAPRIALARALKEASSDTVRARLLYLGSRIADSAFRPVALPYLQSEADDTRRMAVRNLGAYPHSGNAALLREGLDQALGLELHQYLWALEAHGKAAVKGERRRLVAVLGDDWFFNRQRARDMLLRAADSTWPALRRMMPRNPGEPSRREWWLLALDARGGREFLKREAARMTAEERRFFGVAEN